jgi:hypothetical protein
VRNNLFLEGSVFFQDGLYLDACPRFLRVSQVRSGELIGGCFDTSGPLAGDVFQGRITRTDPDNKYWVEIGLAKPALLQHSKKTYTEGDFLWVTLKRPPLQDRFIIKNAEVRDTVSPEDLIALEGKGFGKVGLVLAKSRPWMLYVQQHSTEPFFVLKATLKAEVMKQGIDPERITFLPQASAKELLEGVWREVLEPQVLLTGGGYLLIEEGYTLTAIDVNTGSLDAGHLTASAHPQSEGELFEFALGALNTAIHHLYLRQIGGMILVDLPRFTTQKYMKSLLIEAKKYAQQGLQVLGFTRGGLLELSKKREGPSLKHLLGVSDE